MEVGGESAMTIEIRTPELERLVQDEIQRGNFHTVDDLFTEALLALREKEHPSYRRRTE